MSDGFSERNGIITFEPGVFDMHMHPRVMDPITIEQFLRDKAEQEGRAGLQIYTMEALQAGISGGGLMPNEMMRYVDLSTQSFTTVVPFPISNLDRVRTMESHVHTEAVIPVGIYVGLDPAVDLIKEGDKVLLNEERIIGNFKKGTVGNFQRMSPECLALKLYGAETTGDYNIPPALIPRAVELWHQTNAGKPAILHLEDADVGKVLDRIAKLEGGKEIKVHIAHVSSKEELTAVIKAKQAGMNVTCEVTPHHLFLDSSARDELGQYASMKPTLKSPPDVQFLWDNMEWIDVIASDCAPHRAADKQGEKVTFGVTNHREMLPLLFGAAEQGRITYRALYEKMCLNPRKILNIPEDAFKSSLTFDKNYTYTNRQLQTEKFGEPGYSPFPRTKREFLMAGKILEVVAGESVAYPVDKRTEARTSLTHLIRPVNLGKVAVRG